MMNIFLTALYVFVVVEWSDDPYFFHPLDCKYGLSDELYIPFRTTI